MSRRCSQGCHVTLDYEGLSSRVGVHICHVDIHRVVLLLRSTEGGKYHVDLLRIIILRKYV